MKKWGRNYILFYNFACLKDNLDKNKKYTEQILNLSNNIIVHDLIRKEASNLKEVMEAK